VEHNTAIKLTAEAKKEPLEHLCLKSLSPEKLITA
jgi:hypothetical protein